MIYHVYHRNITCFPVFQHKCVGAFVDPCTAQCFIKRIWTVVEDMGVYSLSSTGFQSPGARF